MRYLAIVLRKEGETEGNIRHIYAKVTRVHRQRVIRSYHAKVMYTSSLDERGEGGEGRIDHLLGKSVNIGHKKLLKSHTSQDVSLQYLQGSF